MMKATILIPILCATLALTVPGAQADDLPTAEQTLDRFVEAVGGRDALERVDNRRSRGVIIQDLTWTDPTHQETPFVASVDAEGKVLYAESTDWTDLDAEAGARLRSKLRWLFDPRWALKVEDFFPGLEVLRIEEREERRVVVLCSPEQDSSYYALYFDLETGLLNHIGYHNDLQDYREVDGVLYPHRFVFGRKGGHTTYRLK